jgi:uncharacterized phage protein (TIGR02218 family)
MSVEITIDALNPIADFFRTPYLPGSHVWLVIERFHRGSSDVSVLFRGLIGAVAFQAATAKLTCIPVRYAIARSIPVQLVGKLCTNTLYDGRCKANPAAFSAAATVTGIAGLTFTVSSVGGRPDGYYSGGFIEKAGVPPATIKEHIGTTLKMFYNPGYVIGDAVTIYAGCDKKFQTCVQKFSNQIHFQAFPFMPLLDPFADEIA